MNTIQKMIFRNTQVVATEQMSKFWKMKDDENFPQALRVRNEIESDWNFVSKVIAENETPEMILAAVKQHEFTDAGEAFIECTVREQCRFAME